MKNQVSSSFPPPITSPLASAEGDHCQRSFVQAGNKCVFPLLIVFSFWVKYPKEFEVNSSLLVLSFPVHGSENCSKPTGSSPGPLKYPPPFTPAAFYQPHSNPPATQIPFSTAAREPGWEHWFFPRHCFEANQLTRQQKAQGKLRAILGDKPIIFSYHQLLNLWLQKIQQRQSSGLDLLCIWPSSFSTNKLMCINVYNRNSFEFTSLPLRLCPWNGKIPL